MTNTNTSSSSTSSGSSSSVGSSGGSSSGSSTPTVPGCTYNGTAAPCIGSDTTAASNWGTPTFDDEFTDPIGTASNDDSKWSPGWFNTSGISNPVNNAENDCFSSNQVSVGTNGLDLQLIAQTSTCTKPGSTSTFNAPYTTGIVTTDPDGGTANGYTFTYGYMEAKVYFTASASGTTLADWPGFWATTLPGAATYDEIDVVEGLGGGSSNQACYHFHNSSAAPGNCASGNYSGWHTFGADWQPGSITYYYDGVEVGQITSSTTPIGSTPMYLLLNNSVYSGDPLPVAPSNMLVRYVRVWQ